MSTEHDEGTGTGDAMSGEDRKLLTLARATRARIGAAEGVAVRDGDGRTYAAATVELPSLRLSAVQAVVAMAHASGSRVLDACVLLGEAEDLTEVDAGVLEDLAGPDGLVVHLGDPRGRVTATRRL